jgi:hypothetical protein
MMEDAEFQAKVEVLLNGILSNDSTLRKSSEQTLMLMRGEAPNPLIIALVTIVQSHSNPSLRMLGAVIARQFCTAFSSLNSWKSLTVETKELIKDRLLAAISQETNAGVRANSSEAVCEVLLMACREQGTSRVVLELLLQWTTSENLNMVELALHTLVRVSTLYSDEVYAKKATLFQLFAYALNSSVVGLKSKATGALCALVSSLESSSAREFQSLLDLVLKVQLDLLRDDEEIGRKGLSQLIELAEAEPQFFSGRLQAIFDLVQHIHLDLTLSFDSERLALELTVTLLERLEETPDKQLIGEGLINVLFESMLRNQADPDSNWVQPADVLEDGEDEQYIESAKLTGRIVEFSGTLDYITQVVVGYISDCKDWRKPYTALLVLSEVTQFDTALVGRITANICKFAESSVHPKTRYAAFYFVKQQCAENQEEFTLPHHSTLLSFLIAGCSDPLPRIVSICCDAVSRFVENSTDYADQQYSLTLLSHLIPLIKVDSNLVVLQQALKAVNEIALLTPKSYALSYEYMLLPLCSLLQSFSSPSEL